MSPIISIWPAVSSWQLASAVVWRNSIQPESGRCMKPWGGRGGVAGASPKRAVTAATTKPSAQSHRRRTPINWKTRPGCSGRQGDPFEEAADLHPDFACVSFKGEMAGVVKMDFGIWIVPWERLRPGREKERIVLAPDCQQGRAHL